MGKGLVLIVEDEPTISASLVELLEVEDYSTQVAGNGKIAWEFLQTTSIHPKAILLDLMMPICSGYEFLEMIALRPEYSALSIILISAAANAVATAQKHQVALVRKPLDADALLKALEKIP